MKRLKRLLAIAAAAVVLAFSGYSLFFFLRWKDVLPKKVGVRVPVLMYHAVAETPWGEERLFVTPSDFEAQLCYLNENGYETVTFEDLCHLEDFKKPVLLTFDDGYDDNYTTVYPLLRRYNAKATVFVITSFLGREHYLTEAQVKELSESGLVSIQSHTESHEKLPLSPPDTVRRELEQSRDTLTRLTGKTPVAVSYPNGLSSPSVRFTAHLLYPYGVRIGEATYRTGTRAAAVPRRSIYRSTTLEDLEILLQ